MQNSGTFSAPPAIVASSMKATAPFPPPSGEAWYARHSPATPGSAGVGRPPAAPGADGGAVPGAELTAGTGAGRSSSIRNGLGSAPVPAAIAVGQNAEASGAAAIAIGSNANAALRTQAAGSSGVAIGSGAIAAGDGSVAHGAGAQTANLNSVAVGREALVARVEASRRVGILEPGVGDGGLADEGLVVRVVSIPRVVAEQRLDLVPIAALPRGHVALEPARDVLAAHRPSLTGPW